MSTSTQNARKALDYFADVLRKWRSDWPEYVADMRQTVCAARGMSEDEFDAWLDKGWQPAAVAPVGGQEPASQYVAGEDPVRRGGGQRRRFVFDVEQAPPLRADYDRHKSDDDRPLIRNWHFRKVKEKVTDSETGEDTIVEKTKVRQLALYEIIQTVQELTGGSLCRVRSQGAREPLLFVELLKQDNTSRIQFLQKSTQFKAFLHNLGKPQFKPKSDGEGTNFSSESDVFNACGESSVIAEYESIQMTPHEPAIPGFYYAWRPPRSGRSPQGSGVAGEDPVQRESGANGFLGDGSKLKGLLKFFSNVKAPKDLAILLSAILTPGWGGRGAVRFGCRPLLVFTAVDQGSGKTTIAQSIGNIWGGWMPLQLTAKQEEEFIQRALSPGGLLTKLVVIDNILGTLKSGFIEAMITDFIIRGKRMYQGDASRPNDLCWIATLNNAKLSRDMAERSFIVELNRPEKRASWAKDLAEFIHNHKQEIICDCLSLLRNETSGEKLGLSDRWSVWSEEVLARACVSAVVKEVAAEFLDEKKKALDADPENPELQEQVELWSKEISPKVVLRENQNLRDDCDQDTEAAIEIWEGLRDKVAQTYIREGDDVRFGEKEFRIKELEGVETIFVKSAEMSEWMKEIIGRRELNAKWIKDTITSHYNAGRLPDVWYYKGTGRGYRVNADPIREHLERLKKEYEDSLETKHVQQEFNYASASAGRGVPYL